MRKSVYDNRLERLRKVLMGCLKRIMVHSSIDSLRRKNMIPQKGGIPIKSLLLDYSRIFGFCCDCEYGYRKGNWKIYKPQDWTISANPARCTGVVAVPERSGGLHFFIARHQWHDCHGRQCWSRIIRIGNRIVALKTFINYKLKKKSLWQVQENGQPSQPLLYFS